jgi:glycosyltransferase involved in cell wall biosynthesis
MARVLYLSYDGMTDPLGQSQVLPYLSGLSKKGFSITLISFEKPERFAKDKAVIEKICRESGIGWHPMQYTKRPPVISTLIDVRKMKRKAFALHADKSFSIVHCRSYIASLAGLSLKRKKNIPFLFDMRGFWADERLEGNIWNAENPVFKRIYRFFKKKEEQFFTGSDAVISLTHEGKKTILEMLPQIGEPKITVIPCCADLALFDPEKTSSDGLREQYGIQDSYVVGYVGSIGTWYMLDEMLLAFQRISALRQNASFLFVTKDDPQLIMDQAAKTGVPAEKIVIAQALHSEVPRYISLFDVSLFFIRPTFSKKASSPTKQGEIMAMGIPLICNAGVGDTDAIVKNYRAGIVLPDTSEKTLSSFQFDLSHFDPAMARKGAEDIYSLENGVRSYESVYRCLLSGKNQQF